MNSTNYKNLLHALSVGDGYIHRNVRENRDSFSLRIRHCSRQSDYLKYKAELLEHYLGGKVRLHSGKQNGFDFVQLSKGHPYLRYVHENLYLANKKVITSKVLNKIDPLGLSIWYQDDGSLARKKRDGIVHAAELKFCLYSCSEQEARLFCTWMKERYLLNFSVVRNKGRFNARCGTKEARKFRDIVLEFTQPCMLYKLDIPKGSYLI
jgi:recombination protein RecA